ncbi:microtubule-associated protein futsch-like [Littorina saxatilis]|uniref:Uncharacterized protein n=1 Tax=Littorina saxatilis TaxID=31220 RepID=A0AAN9ARJ7_9CAEN
MPPARGRGRGARGRQPATQARKSTRTAAATPTKDRSPEAEEDAAQNTETICTEEEIDGSGQDVQMQVSDEPAEAEYTAEQVDNATASSSIAEMKSTDADGTQSQPGSKMEEGECSTVAEDGKKRASVPEKTDDKAEQIDVDDATVDNAEQSEPKAVIIIEDDKRNDEERAGEQENKTPALVWRVRMCPVPFSYLCHMDDHFQKMMRLCQSFEFRMSKLLLQESVKDADPTFQAGSDIQWHPGSMTRAEANTFGMVEMKVEDASLVELVHSARRAKCSQQHTIRFELKQLSREETLLTEQKKDAEHVDNGQVEGDAKKLTKDLPSQDPSAEALLVNFAVTPEHISTGENADRSDSETREEEKEDSYLIVNKVPDQVPDNVLQAVFLTDMVDRQRGENSTGTATFDAGSPQEAGICLRQYDGVLVNLEVLEIATAQGTLQDHVEKDDILESADITIDQQEAREVFTTMRDMLEVCKAEILKALPKSAIPDKSDAAGTEGRVQVSAAEKAASEKKKTRISEKVTVETSEKAKVETLEKKTVEISEKKKTGTSEKEKTETLEKEKTGTSEKEKTGTSEKEKTGTSEKEKTGTSEKEKTGTSEKEKTGTSEKETSGKEISKEGRETAKKSSVPFPQSLKVQEATKLINKWLSNWNVSSLKSSIMFPKAILPKNMLFSLDRECRPYCDIYCDIRTQAYKEPFNSNKEIADTWGVVIVPLKMALTLEGRARALISLASFQDLATCALTEILKKDDLDSDDLTSLKHIVEGLHSSTLTMGGSALAFFADVRLLRRDSYLKNLNASSSKKLSLRAAPFETAEFFGGKEIEAQSGEKTMEQGPAKEEKEGEGGPTESSESSKAVQVQPQKDLKKDKDSKTKEKEPENKAQDKKAKEDSQSKATMEECRLEIARCLHELACSENPGSDTIQEEAMHGDGNAASPDLKSHDILQLVEVLNSLLSAPSFNASSFVQTSALPLRYWYWRSHYETIGSLFDVKPPQPEAGLHLLGAKGQNQYVVFRKNIPVQFEKNWRSLTALACFMERASYALKLLSEQDEVSIADVESMRRLVKGLSLGAPVAVGEAVLTAASLQVTRRISYAKRMESATEDVKKKLIKCPLGSGGVFGPDFSKVFRASRGRLAREKQNNLRLHDGERMRRPPPPRPGRSGVAAKRLQGAYRGVSRGGKLLHQPSRGAYPGGSRGATRGPPMGSNFDARRGGRSGSSRGGQQGLPRRGGNVSRQGPRNVNWTGSPSRGRIPSLLGEIPRGAGPREPDCNIQAVHAGIQAQMQAAQRELMMLQEQARLTQARIRQEHELLQNYDQEPFHRARSAPYQREVRHDRRPQSGRNNRPSGQQYFREKGPTRRGNRNRNQ